MIQFHRKNERRNVEIIGETFRGRFLRVGKSQDVGVGLLRRELPVVSGGERGGAKIAIPGLVAAAACALSGIGRRSTLSAFDLRGSVRGYETEAQKQR